MYPTACLSQHPQIIYGFFFCFFFPAVILPILMFMQKETTFKRELKYFQQFLVSICVIFYLIFFSFL